jgi:hypothetical protein
VTVLVRAKTSAVMPQDFGQAVQGGASIRTGHCYGDARYGVGLTSKGEDIAAALGQRRPVVTAKAGWRLSGADLIVIRIQPGRYGFFATAIRASISG